MPVAGLEPARCRHRWILSPLRLPIPSHRQIYGAKVIIQQLFSKIKYYFYKILVPLKFKGTREFSYMVFEFLRHIFAPNRKLNYDK